ncbi:MAG: hypothetical protein LBJ96_04075 [Holosporaceae bacterium]|jgi:hypothetical protein|nr:hypothetical protein [Holosporaceae bacterium]
MKTLEKGKKFSDVYSGFDSCKLSNPSFDKDSGKILSEITEKLKQIKDKFSESDEIEKAGEMVELREQCYRDFLKCQILLIINKMDQDSALKDVAAMKSTVVAEICSAIVAEKEHGYSKYTTEHVILAFIGALLEAGNVKDFLDQWRKYRESVFKEEYISEMSGLGRDKIMEKAKQVYKEFENVAKRLPYNAPVDNGDAFPCEIDTNGKIVKVNNSKPFADCVDTSLRHTFNYVLGTEKIEDIRCRVRNEFEKESKNNSVVFTPDRLEEAKEFREMGEEKMNSSASEVRTSWNRVVSCLNFGCTGSRIKYARGSNSRNENELESGFVNFTKALAAVLGVRFGGITGDNAFSFLKRLFNCINQQREYILVDSVSSKGDEIYGELSVEIKVKGICLAKFEIVQKSGHGCVQVENTELYHSSFLIIEIQTCST